MIDITEEYLKERIYEIRGQRVILDADLSEIYGYTTKAFNQQVKNNIEKFDEDFMFELTDDEVENLRSNFLTANLNSKSRYNPHVFTEQGIYMLATVLRGKLAEQQSIFIMRTFREMRHYIRQNQQFVIRNEMDLLTAMEGRVQKAREGKRNGGFAPYGYSLIDGKLEVNEEEAVAIRMIFDQYVNTDYQSVMVMHDEMNMELYLSFLQSKK